MLRVSSSTMRTVRPSSDVRFEPCRDPRLPFGKARFDLVEEVVGLFDQALGDIASLMMTLSLRRRSAVFLCFGMSSRPV